MRENPYLFSSGQLRDYLETAIRDLIREIESLPPERITSTDENQLHAYLTEKYSITTPVLDETHINVDQEDAQIDVSHDPTRLIIDRTRPLYISGTIVTHYVPFTGNPDVFRLRPSHYSSKFPAATIADDELLFTYEETRHDATAVRHEFTTDITETKKLLAWADNEIKAHNEKVATTTQQRLSERRAKLAKDQQLVEQLGYPLRRRPDAPDTYHVPIARKHISLPPATRGPLEPAPLTDDTYEEILRIITSMVLVMERSPNTFRHVDEHFLRTLFLVTLNAQFEGQATGETFNYQGKTDILIRHENRNLFIAECKFWRGPHSLTETIDQLLRYAQWRDTKTAILLFNRTKDFTSILHQVPEIAKAHPNFVQQHAYDHETGYRCTLRQQDDPHRHLTLTILAFNIPS